jgi:hypothetical protein
MNDVFSDCYTKNISFKNTDDGGVNKQPENAHEQQIVVNQLWDLEWKLQPMMITC